MESMRTGWNVLEHLICVKRLEYACGNELEVDCKYNAPL